MFMSQSTDSRFEQVLFLPGHKGSVWGLELSPDGSICYSVGQDRSIRTWERGEDLVFVEEERERALEALVDKAAESNEGHSADSGMGGEISSAVAGLKSIESVKGGEALMEALDLAEAELADEQEFQAIQAAAKAAAALDSSAKSKPSGPKQRNANPLMLGLCPYKYMLRALRQIKAPDLEQALIVLPFDYVTRLIAMLIELAKRGLDLELCAKCAVFLLHCHQPQIVHTQSLLSELTDLQGIISTSVNSYRNLIGSNIAGLRYANRILEERKEEGILGSTFEQLPPATTNKKGKKKARHN